MGEYGGRGRYRNRVEFKGSAKTRMIFRTAVDIGTEWNLKFLYRTHIRGRISRYRNRVEFKAFRDSNEETF